MAHLRNLDAPVRITEIWAEPFASLDLLESEEKRYHPPDGVVVCAFNANVCSGIPPSDCVGMIVAKRVERSVRLVLLPLHSV